MYGSHITLNIDFNTAIETTTEALQTEGFGVLTDIDVAGTLKKKLDVDRLPYRILGACNPGLAKQAIEAEPNIGLLLPCNVVIRAEKDGSTSIAFMNTNAVLGLVDSDDISKLAALVEDKLQRVKTQLESTHKTAP